MDRVPDRLSQVCDHPDVLSGEHTLSTVQGHASPGRLPAEEDRTHLVAVGVPVGTEVLAGTLQLEVDGRRTTMGPGDVAVVPPGRSHTWWNVGDEEARVLGDFRPALRTEMFFETLFGLAKDGKVNSRGLPNLLRLAVIMREYDDEILLARPPAAVQRAPFAPLAALGHLLGHRGWYPDYTSEPLAKTRPKS